MGPDPMAGRTLFLPSQVYLVPFGTIFIAEDIGSPRGIRALLGRARI